MSRKRFFSLLLCAALVLILLPMTAQAADAITWTSRTSGTLNWICSVTYGSSKFVAVGGSGTILTSGDGVNWISQDSGTTRSLTSIIYGNNTFVVVGYAGTILTSADGVTWANHDPITSTNINRITYGNNVFAAVGYSGTILTSGDGVTWTSQTSGTDNNLYGVTYGDNKFMAVGDDNTILTSEDGVTWANQTSGDRYGLINVTYGGNEFVAVGRNGTILTSGDGETWASKTVGTSELFDVTYGNNMFVAAGMGGTILISTDGNAWTSQSPVTFHLYGVTCGNNKFVVVGEGGGILTAEVYPVTYTLTGLTTDGIGYAQIGGDYTATFTTSTGYLLPASISVTVGGIPAILAAGVAEADTAGKYYYNLATGAVKVAAVNGAVVIAAAGVAKTYTITAIPASLDFGSATVGYATPPAEQTVTVENTGNQSITLSYPAITGTDYTISALSGTSLAAGEKATFTVRPKTALAVGGHADTITVSGTNDMHTATAQVQVSFTVTRAAAGGDPGPTYTLRTLTDSATGVTLTGSSIHELAKLTVSPLAPHPNDPACDAIRKAQKEGQVILGVDIGLSRGFIAPLTISIPVGSQYNGKKVTILHCINGKLETIIATVVDGMATFTVKELSPFAVTTGLPIQDEITGVPNTGDTASSWGFLLIGLAAACAGYMVMKRRKA